MWAYDTLTGDATLTTLVGSGSIRVVPVEGSPPYPRVIISVPFSGPDTVALDNGASRVMASPTLQVDVIADDGVPWVDIEGIAARVDALLDGAGSITVAGRGEIIGLYRTEVSTNVDEVGDRLHRRIMQRYASDALAA